MIKSLRNLSLFVRFSPFNWRLNVCTHYRGEISANFGPFGINLEWCAEWFAD
jgi:hypothetical protein